MARKRGMSRKAQAECLLEAARAVVVPSSCDVCVMGGGASGLVAAITAAERGASVVVIERDIEAGRGILATGSGRCNFANVDLAAKHYNDPDFVASVMGAEPLDSILSFFRTCGLAWCQEQGRLYPRSLQAASVRNVLLSRARAAGVTLACARTALDVTTASSGLEIAFEESWEGGSTRTLACGSLVMACGGPRDGSPLPSLDVPRVTARPVLCALSCEASPLDALDGRRATCAATLVRNGREVVARERGEALFRKGGLSGIVTFDLSRHAQPGDVIELDLLPDHTPAEVEQRLGLRPCISADYQPTPRAALDGMVDPEIARLLLGLADGPWADAHLPRRLGSVEGSGVVALAKGLPFHVTGVADPTHAQVVAGGIALGAVSPETLSLQGHERVFACGEALDVDGACGGYNLAFAWTSGMRAGASAERVAR